MIIQPRPQEALLKSLLRQSPQVPDVGGLRNWQVFTKAAGQSDGHLKHPTESTRVEGSKWESLWYLSLKCYGCYGLSSTINMGKLSICAGTSVGKTWAKLPSFTHWKSHPLGIVQRVWWYTSTQKVAGTRMAKFNSELPHRQNVRIIWDLWQLPSGKLT